MRRAPTHRAAALAAVALLASGMATPTPLRAQPLPASPAAPGDAGSRAVALGREGVQLYEAGSWAAAETKLAEAEAILHSPVFVLYIARSRRNAGRLLDAREVYRRMVSESLAPTAPPAWTQALVDARAELTVLERNIPTLTVRVPDGSPSTQATIDGRAVSLGSPMELDAGQRVVVVVDGARRAEASVDLRMGERGREVSVPLAPAVAPQQTRPPSIVDAERSPRGGSWVPGAVVLGLGAVGLGVGAVTGASALGASGEVEDACPGGVCPASVPRGSHDQQLADAETMADVSTVAFVAGGVLGAAGIVLLVVRPFGDGDDGVAVRAGARSVALRGSF